MIGLVWIRLCNTFSEELISPLVLVRQIEAEGKKNDDKECVAPQMRGEGNAAIMLAQPNAYEIEDGNTGTLLSTLTLR